GGGERAGGRTTASHVELQASRAVARWWDVFAGMRHDIRPGEPRTAAALGVGGLAPCMVEVSATAYLGAGGLGAELGAEYELGFTHRLVPPPSLELELDARDDQARGTGRGLSTAEAGLRLRYEVTRRFAPYVGVVHERAFGATARARETVGGHARETRVVAGVRIWFWGEEGPPGFPVRPGRKAAAGPMPGRWRGDGPGRPVRAPGRRRGRR